MTIQKLPGTAILSNSIAASAIATTISPKISAVTVTDSGFTTSAATAIALTGGYAKLTGSGFVTGCTVVVGSTVATSVSFVSATQVNVQVPALVAGTYIIYLVNPDGGVAIRVNGINYSSTPTWSTSTSLPGGVVNNALSIQLAAASDSTMSYSLQAGSTLPTGLTLSSGGLLSGSVTGLAVATTYNFTIVATDLESQATPQAFSINIQVADPYFNSTVLLLNADATTFIKDASTNNFELTATGAPSANVFHPLQDGYYSNYISSANYFYTASSAAFAPGTSNFTLEAWVYPTAAYGTYNYIFGVAANGGLVFYVLGGTSLGVRAWNVADQLLSSTLPALNVWTHVAAVRSGTTLTIYVNGVATATATNSYNFVAGAAYVGNDSTNAAPWVGYISNLRLVNGTAVYTGNFAPPALALTAIANTSLLTCQSNRFIDNSTNAFAITKTGSPTVAVQQPFTLPSPYTGYGSGYFNGSSDYLTVSSSATLNPAAANFTVECWIYPTSAPISSGIVSSSASGGLQISYYSTTGIGICSQGLAWLVYSTVVPTVNMWNHIVCCRGGTGTNQASVFLNGVRIANGTAATTFAQGNVFVGYSPTTYFPGYISNVRMIVGTDLYGYTNTTITVPTTPLTAVSGTSLLTLQTNQAQNNNQFRDSSQNNFAITRTGTPTQGTFTPFSQTGWSGYFNGSTDYLTSGSGVTNAGTGDFSWECWVYYTGAYSNYGHIWDSRTTAGGYTDGFGIAVDITTGYWAFDFTVQDLHTSTPNIPNTWQHICATRQSGVIRFFVNGILAGTLTSSNNLTSTTNVIGKAYNGLYPWAGYASNLRVIKGSVPAAYQTSSTTIGVAIFTPGTTPLTAVSGTSLLTLQSNYFKDNSSNNFAITRTGTPSIQAISPFNSGVNYNPAVVGGSMYFIDNTTTLSSISTTIQQFAAGDFTVEMWAYFVTIPGSSPELFQAGNFHLNFRGSPNIAITNDASVLSNLSNTIYPGVWTHIAAVRASGTMIIYLNGVGNTPSTSQTYSFSQAAISIGSGASGFNAYISGLRIVNGIAVYTTNFAPPTALLTAINGTNLLLNGANSGIFDATGKNDIWTVGTTKVSNAIFKYGTGSMYFNGTTDYLTTTYSPNTQLGAGNFTIEFWVYFNSVAASQRLAGGDQPTGAGSGYNWCFFTGTGTLTYYLGSNGSGWDLAGGVLIGSVVISQWYHVALVRNGATVTPYLNGVAGTTTSVSTTALYANTYGPTIGAQNTAYFSGYIDDFRITKGVARYTTAFTPPASAFLGS